LPFEDGRCLHKNVVFRLFSVISIEGLVFHALEGLVVDLIVELGVPNIEEDGVVFIEIVVRVYQLGVRHRAFELVLGLLEQEVAGDFRKGKV